MSTGSALNRSQKRRLATDFTSEEATPEEAPAPIRDQLPRIESPACLKRNPDPSVHPSVFAHERGTTGPGACSLLAASPGLRLRSPQPGPYSESSTWLSR